MVHSGAALANEDLIVSLLRVQVERLAKVLMIIETGKIMDDYLDESLLQAERDIKRVRRLLSN